MKREHSLLYMKEITISLWEIHYSLNYFPIITRYDPFKSSTYLSKILHMSLNQISMIFSLEYSLHNYLLETVEEIYVKSFLWINPSHIPTHYKAHPYFWDISEKHVNFLIFNHKFTYNTKINKVEIIRWNPHICMEMVW